MIYFMLRGLADSERYDLQYFNQRSDILLYKHQITSPNHQFITANSWIR